MRRIFIIAGVGACACAHAFDFFESEPNDSKAQANIISMMMAGDRIIGNSTSASGTGLDYFLVSTAPEVLGIYRYRLIIDSQTAGHTGTIRGLNQIGAAAGPWPGPVGTAGTTDTTFQTSSTTTNPPRFNQWYGFGKQEQIYYRVAGTTSTTADYQVTLERSVVTPIDIGTYQPGSIVISAFGQGHTTDTDLWVYDNNLDAIPGYGNDDKSAFSDYRGGTTNTSLQSHLERTYAPGRYYIAISNFQMANNMGSPCDDNFRTGTMMDFANSVANGSTTTNLPMTFTVTDSVGGTLQVANTKVGPYDVNWFTFNVVPEPGTFVAIGAGLSLLLARRRRK